MQSQKKQRYYTLMIVPHDARGRPISLKIPASWVYLTVSLLAFSLLLAFSSFVYSTLLSRRLIHYTETLNQNQKQKEIINSFAIKTNKVTKAINELVERDNELRKMLGLRGWKSKINLFGGEPSREARINKISLQLDQTESLLAERRKSLEELRRWVETVRSRFASTPSLWPVYGQISSGFGYRAYPWRGFHRGVDIRAPYGTPIRAAASGVVSYRGWMRGYGKTLEISHGFGVSTLYGHLSGYAVAAGQKVKKGQIVAYVGLTGWTTGSHLHYEVRRFGTAVNPVAYLNLNVLAASRLFTK